jgi:glutaredoxin
VTVVRLYGKPGCHLCDDARAVIADVRESHDFQLEEVDISVDPGLFRRYGERIPVVEVDGVERFQFVVDPAELTRSLDRVGP